MTATEIFVRKYRPTKLDDVAGLSAIKAYFGNEFDSHTFVFHGEAGVGKTTIARIIATMKNYELEEINAADQTGIDAVRELIRRFDRSVLSEKKGRVFVIDEAHKLSNAAQNALLKPVEDGFKQDIIIFCTTEKSKIIKTLLDRCTVFSFPSLTNHECRQLLTKIKDQEGIEDLSDDIVDIIIENAEGSARVAVKLLDEYVRTGDSEAILNYAAASNPDLYNFYIAILNKDNSATQLMKLVKDVPMEPEAMRIGLINLFNARMVNKKDRNCIPVLKSLIQYGSLIDVDKKAKFNLIIAGIRESV